MMKNSCCRALLNDIPGTSGEELTCPTCGKQFIHDGSEWRNLLDLGNRKAEKLRKVAYVNQFVQRSQATSASPAPPSPSTATSTP